jgi:hypothetical protein
MDYILWAIVAAFIIWEAYAHFVMHNRRAHTLSNRISALEKRYPKTRVLVAVVLLVLALHLILNWI